jgi:hypothetical protein
MLSPGVGYHAAQPWLPHELRGTENDVWVVGCDVVFGINPLALFSAGSVGVLSDWSHSHKDRLFPALVDIGVRAYPQSVSALDLGM